MQLSIDPAVLVAETRFSSVNAIIVTNRLVLQQPGDLDAEQRRSLRAMEAAKEKLELVREERAMRQPAKVRGHVLPFNASWTSMSTGIQAICTLPPEIGGARRQRALRVRAVLFPEDGGPGLNVDAETAYVAAKERLDRIARHGLAADIVDLVGREPLDAVKKTTAALGDALGVGRTPRPAATTTPTLADALKQVSRSVARYARRIVADLDEDDPESVARVERALAPLIEHKQSLGRARNGQPEDLEPEDPATDVPPPAPAPPVDPPTE